MPVVDALTGIESRGAATRLRCFARNQAEQSSSEESSSAAAEIEPQQRLSSSAQPWAVGGAEERRNLRREKVAEQQLRTSWKNELSKRK